MKNTMDFVKDIRDIRVEHLGEEKKTSVDADV